MLHGSRDPKMMYFGDIQMRDYILVPSPRTTINVAILAPANSIVSYSGTSSGTIEMGSATSKVVVLKPGTYSFTNTLTINDASTTLYTKSYTINDAVTLIKIYPENVIYWYGISEIAFVDDIISNDWNTSVTQNANNILLSLSRNSNGYANRAFTTKETVDLTGFNSVKGLFSEGVGANVWYQFGAVSSQTDYAPSSDAVLISAYPTVNTIDVSSINESRYIGIMGQSYAKSGTVNCYIHAVWLE